MKNALILHGTDASPEANWFRWIEGFMQNVGYDVWLPQLPNSAHPNVVIYNSFLLGNSNFQFNEKTVLIGHSSGAVEIMSLLQHLPEDVMVGDVYLVSAFKDNLNWDTLDGLFVEDYDYECIKTKVRSITLLHSDNDPYVPLEQARYLSEKLNARLLVFAEQGHFNLEKSEDYRKFPLLAQVIETHDILNATKKLTTFRGEPVVFVENQAVKDGVDCDVYCFVDDDTKDLGIIHVMKDFQTPKQLIVKGDRTTEGFLAGAADLTFSYKNQNEVTDAYSNDSYGVDRVLGVGDTMQWSTSENSVLYEICHPAYEDGRFRDL